MESSKSTPIRSCKLCRQRFPQEELIRFGEFRGSVCEDRKRLLPGRGAYICAKDYEKLLSLLALAKKAGALKTGEVATMDAIKSEKTKLVIIAGDASDNTKKQYMDKAGYRSIQTVIISDSQSLGRITGKDTVMGMAVLDDGLSKAFRDKLHALTREWRYHGKNESI